MKTYLRITIVLGVLFAMAPRDAHAQLPNGYGSAIPVETARKVAAAAIAEAKKNGWTVAAAILDTGGDLVFFERMDNTQVASTIVAQEKARTAFEDALNGGRQAILSLPGVTPIEGGIPLVIDGKIVGAIGVSGATSPQDAQCAQMGADTLGKQPTLPPPPAKPPTPAPPAPPKK
jgi:uncharacterized protein GlcG (DUF336 family)